MQTVTRNARRDEPEADDGEEGLQQYLTFVLGGETFAIGILQIKEIIEFGGFTTVPMMPNCIRGVINLRGAVVPVLDLSARFGRPSTDTTRRTCVVIVEVQSGPEPTVIGVIVDEVNEVLEIPASEIEPAPRFGTRLDPELISGMGKIGGKFVILLDAERVLSMDDLDAATGKAAQAFRSEDAARAH